MTTNGTTFSFLFLSFSFCWLRVSACDECRRIDPSNVRQYLRNVSVVRNLPRRHVVFSMPERDFVCCSTLPDRRSHQVDDTLENGDPTRKTPLEEPSRKPFILVSPHRRRVTPSEMPLEIPLGRSGTRPRSANSSLPCRFKTLNNTLGIALEKSRTSSHEKHAVRNTPRESPREGPLIAHRGAG